MVVAAVAMMQQLYLNLYWCHQGMLKGSRKSALRTRDQKKECFERFIRNELVPVNF